MYIKRRKASINPHFDFGVGMGDGVSSCRAYEAIAVGPSQLLDEMLFLVDPRVEIFCLPGFGHLYSQLHGGGELVIFQDCVQRIEIFKVGVP